MSTNDGTPDPTAGERIAAGRIAHGVGSSDYLPGNVQHLVSPIVGILRRLQHDAEPLPATEMEWVIDRLMLTLDFAREHDAASTPASEGLTKDEREALDAAVMPDLPCVNTQRVVERIKADAEAKARAEAWDEGYESAICDTEARSAPPGPNGPVDPTPNPYGGDA